MNKCLIKINVVYNRQKSSHILEDQNCAEIWVYDNLPNVDEPIMIQFVDLLQWHCQEGRCRYGRVTVFLAVRANLSFQQLTGMIQIPVSGGLLQDHSLKILNLKGVSSTLGKRQPIQFGQRNMPSMNHSKPWTVVCIYHGQEYNLVSDTVRMEILSRNNFEGMTVWLLLLSLGLTFRDVKLSNAFL